MKLSSISLLVLACLPLIPPIDAHARQEDPVEAPSVTTDEVETPGSERAMELAEEARRAVAAHYGEDPGQLMTPVVVVSRKTLRDGVAKDLTAQFQGIVPEESLEQTVDLQARFFSIICMARYCTSSARLELCIENLEKIAALLEDPILTSEGALRAMLVHEFIHARDAREHSLADFTAGRASFEELEAVSAVLEGHAQHVSRKVCSTNGWTTDFERFTASLDSVPPSIEDPQQRLAANVQAQTTAFAYLEGERFVRAIEAARGPEGLTALFTHPPTEQAQILHPDWYLDPQSRPVATVDAKRGLDRFAELLVPEEYLTNVVSVAPAVIRASLQGVDEGQVDRFIKAMLSVEASVGQDPGNPNEQRVAALYEFRSPGEALNSLIVQRAILTYRDEISKGQPIEVTRAEYTDLKFESGARGLLADKTVDAMGTEVEAVVVILARENAMIELSSFDNTLDIDLLTSAADEILSVALDPGGEEVTEEEGPENAEEPEGPEDPQDSAGN
ncbi:MAG: zinc-dependent metalloprotease [Planctomycetota bacterium]